MEAKRMLVMAALATALVVGLGWSVKAMAQQGPPDDDAGFWPDFGLGPGADVDAPDQPPGPPGAPGDVGNVPPRPGMAGRPDMGGGRGMKAERRREELDRIKKEDPERYKRIMKIRDLSMEYRNSDDDKRKKEIEKELRPLIDKELRIQQEENKKKVDNLEKRLNRMKKILKEREDHWDEVVDYTVKEATGQNDYLKAWKGPGGRGRGDRP